MNKSTVSEKDIQDYIWQNGNDFKSLLEEVILPQPIVKEKPWEIEPWEILYNIVIERYNSFYNSLWALELINEEVHLVKDGDSTIRADFLGIINGGDSNDGLVVIELKKENSGSEREAFTQLLAYGNHLKTIFAPMGKRDVKHILIAPMKQRIVREAMLHSIIFDRKNILAFIPKIQDNDINTLKLKLWLPEQGDFKNLAYSCFSVENFDGFKIAFDSFDGIWSPAIAGDVPDADMKDRLNRVASYTSQLMEANGINGFVFCSQLWSEANTDVKNSLIIFGLNPYKATISRAEINPEQIDNIDSLLYHKLYDEYLNKLSCSSFNQQLSYYDFLYKNNYDIDVYVEYEDHIIETLADSYYHILCELVFEAINLFTINSLNYIHIRKEGQSFTWRTFLNSGEYHQICHNFNIYQSGIIRELFWRYSKLDYEYIKNNGIQNHLHLYNKDIPMFLVDMFHSHGYFVESFLERLFTPGKWVDESLDMIRSELRNFCKSKLDTNRLSDKTEYINDCNLVKKNVYIKPTDDSSDILLFILEFIPGKSEVHFTPSQGFNTSKKEKTTITTKDELTKLLEDWLKNELSRIIPLIS